MGKVDYESEIFLIQRYITLWKGTTASVDIISLSSKFFHDSCFKPAERRKYFFRYSLYVGENSFDLKQVAIISAETCQMVLNLILASICIEKNWGDEKILVIPVTWQISAQPLFEIWLLSWSNCPFEHWILSGGAFTRFCLSCPRPISEKRIYCWSLVAQSLCFWPGVMGWWDHFIGLEACVGANSVPCTLSLQSLFWMWVGTFCYWGWWGMRSLHRRMGGWELCSLHFDAGVFVWNVGGNFVLLFSFLGDDYHAIF